MLAIRIGHRAIVVHAQQHTHRIVVGNGRLPCAESTMGEISGKTFEHTDENELVRK